MTYNIENRTKTKGASRPLMQPLGSFDGHVARYTRTGILLTPPARRHSTP